MTVDRRILKVTSNQLKVLRDVYHEYHPPDGAYQENIVNGFNKISQGIPPTRREVSDFIEYFKEEIHKIEEGGHLQGDPDRGKWLSMWKRLLERFREWMRNNWVSLRENPIGQKITRKDINEYISICLKKMVQRGHKVDAASGGGASPSGIWQGEEAEGRQWGGDFADLSWVRKVTLPGDWIDFYVYQRYGFGGEWDLRENVVVRIPDPNRGIKGECYKGSIGHPE